MVILLSQFPLKTKNMKRNKGKNIKSFIPSSKVFTVICSNGPNPTSVLASTDMLYKVYFPNPFNK